MRAILTWHSIDPSGSPISVSREEWRAQLSWLATGGARVMSVEALLRDREAEPAVALTFDDGFANFSTEAAPLLAEYGFPATVFVVSGHVGGDNRWRGMTSTAIPRLPLLGWDELGRLAAGGITIGAHTRTHPHLDRLTSPDELEAELGGCADDMAARLGVRPTLVAYPYGEYAPTTLTTASRHYQWGCTTELRAMRASDQPLEIPRLDVHYLRAPSRLGRWGSATMRSWLWFRRGGRRIRSALPWGGP